MNGISCNVPECERRISKLENDFDGLSGRLLVLDKDFAVYKESIIQSLKTLSILPDSLNQLKDTMTSMQRFLDDNNRKIENLGKEVGELKNTVDSINDEGKLNIRKYMRDNWITLFITAGGLAAIGSTFVK